jgi:hypothetical protein
MTYFIAWKSQNAAYVVADTAITTYGPVPELIRTTSAIGETHIYDKKRGYSVCEETLKISEFGNVLYAFAGAEAVGLPFGKNIQSHLVNGLDPETAVTRCLDECTRIPNDGSMHCVVAFHDGQQARILTANTELPEIQEVDSIISGGSMPGWFDHQLKLVPALLNPTIFNAGETLLTMVSLLQTFGIHEYLMPQGIGGFYQGLAVCANGVIRTPSCAYMPYDGTTRLETRDLVAIVHRANIVMIRKGVDTRYAFVECLYWQSLGKPKNIHVQGTEKIDRFETSYICFVRLDCRRVYLLENRNHKGHPLLVVSKENPRPMLSIDGALRSFLFSPSQPDPTGTVSLTLIRPDRGGAKTFDVPNLKVQLRQARF